MSISLNAAYGLGVPIICKYNKGISHLLGENSLSYDHDTELAATLIKFISCESIRRSMSNSAIELSKKLVNIPLYMTHFNRTIFFVLPEFKNGGAELQAYLAACRVSLTYRVIFISIKNTHLCSSPQF